MARGIERSSEGSKKRRIMIDAGGPIALHNLLWPVTTNHLYVLTNKHAVLVGCFAFWPVNYIYLPKYWGRSVYSVVSSETMLRLRLIDKRGYTEYLLLKRKYDRNIFKAHTYCELTYKIHSKLSKLFWE